MLYNTGARVSEIMGVRLSDVVLNGTAFVTLHGKGRKQRTVPLWRSTVKTIRAWLRLNPEIGLCFVAAAKPCGPADDSQQRDATARSRGEGRQQRTSWIA